jgi:hypothetical protein
MSRPLPDTLLQRALTVRQFAHRYAIGKQRVLGMLKSGGLGAVKLTGPGGKVTYRILPHHISEWEERNAAAETPAPVRRRRRTTVLDFYPD